VSEERVPRGFTVLEIVIALGAGLVVTLAALLLTRTLTTGLDREARLGDAQLGVLLGMHRLGGDVQRAGLLASANLRADPTRCGGLDDWPEDLRELAAVYVERDGSVVRHPGDHGLSALNGLAPDALELAGSFEIDEPLAVRAIEPVSGGAVEIHLEPRSGALARALRPGRRLAELARPGRRMRITDVEGRNGWGVIEAVDDADPARPRVRLGGSARLWRRSAGDVCGPSGFATGTFASVVTRVRYDLRAVRPQRYPAWAGLYAKGRHDALAAHVGEAAAARTELVRVEIDADGAEIDASLEVVAEHAVDFEVGLTRAVVGAAATTLERLAIGDARVYETADRPGAGGSPETIRSLQLRLAVRGAEPEGRGPEGASYPLAYRLGMGARPPTTRVRVLHVDVALPNLAGGW
jgi:hypothetical protein